MSATSRGYGQLAESVLAVLRAADEPLSAGEVRDRLAGGDLAYTTVLTVLTRLCQRGDAVRHARSPRRVRFAPAPMTAQDVSDQMHQLLPRGNDRQAVLLRFAGDLDDDDARALRAALERHGRR